jgi:CRP-like cAMP-binding protein
MSTGYDLGMASLLGLGTTSSAIAGVALGLYWRFSKRVLACVLAFAAGALISALAIELGYEGARTLHDEGFSSQAAWLFISCGFAAGAIIYYWTSLFLEGKGAAVRYATQFREFALARKQSASRENIALLAKCDFLRHLPPEKIEDILPCLKMRHLHAGEILFRAGDPGDALFIVARGAVDVLTEPIAACSAPVARLGEGQAFGEMALLSGGPRTATIRGAEETQLLEIGKADFQKLLASDHQMARAVEHISHDRAISNLHAGGPNPEIWARLARQSLDHITRSEANRLLGDAGKHAGIAIVLGNILDTIPGCLVIGAKFTGFETLSLTLMLGMFLGGIPEAAASASMLTKAGYRPSTIFNLWSVVLVAGMLAALAGKAFIGNSDALVAIFSQALAGGAVLALVAHAMIPEAIEEGGSVIVLPTVAGFLFALYLALMTSLG